MLKHVLHDWSDENCVRILENIHAVAKPDTKLLLVEFILNESNKPQFAKITDLEMLVISSYGRERTRVEWENLLRARWISTNEDHPYKIRCVRDRSGSLPNPVG